MLSRFLDTCSYSCQTVRMSVHLDLFYPGGEISTYYARFSSLILIEGLAQFAGC